VAPSGTRDFPGEQGRGLSRKSRQCKGNQLTRGAPKRKKEGKRPAVEVNGAGVSGFATLEIALL